MLKTRDTNQPTKEIWRHLPAKMSQMKIPNAFQFCTLIVCSAVLALTSCSGPSTVPGEPVTDSNPPEFESETKAVVSGAVGNGLDVSFVHQDHFACVSVDVGKILGNPELNEVPWDTFEEQLARLIGPSNSDLSKINRVWVMADRDSVSFGESDGNQFPFVFVIDFESIGDETEMSETIASLKEGQEESETIVLAVKKMGPKRVAIARPKLLEKVGSSRARSNMSQRLSVMTLDSDVEGILDIQSIRPQLQMIFDLVASFGGKQTETISKLSDALQRVEISIDLEADDLLNAVAFIDDEELTKKVAMMATEAQQGNGGGGAAGMLGMPFGMGAGVPGMGRSGSPSVAMFEPSAAEVMKAIGEEIKEKNLVSISGKGNQLAFNLKRPTKLKELIESSVFDAKRQMNILDRAQKMAKIGTAMKAYFEAHECFPPAGVVKGDENGLPDQFNWRVGLLPFLDQQEVYDRFDFSEAWNSKKNLEAASDGIDVFTSSQSGESEADENEIPSSRFQVVGGKLGLYAGGRIPKRDDIKDKKNSTAVVIEAAEANSVAWTKPGAMEIDAIKDEVFGKPDENGILMINASFKVRIVKREMDLLTGVISPQGGEQIKRTDFIPSGME